MPAYSLPDPMPNTGTHTRSPRSHRLHNSMLRRLKNVVAPVVCPSQRNPRQDPLSSFDWPEEDTLAAMGNAIAAARGLEVIVMPIPDGLRHQEISGLTTVTGRTAYVFYDADLSPLNREQTILHEYAHILHGDVRADADSTHLRSMFDDPIEKRAERTGMRLLERMRGRQRARARRQGSEVLAFFSGSDDGTELP